MLTEMPVRNLTPNGGTLVEFDSYDAGAYYVDTHSRTGVIDVKMPELLLLYVFCPGGTEATPSVAAGQGAAPGVSVRITEDQLVSPLVAAGQGLAPVVLVDTEDEPTDPEGPEAGGAALLNDPDAPLTVRVDAGTYSPATAAVLGPVEYTIPPGTGAWIGPFESARVLSAHVNVAEEGQPEQLVTGAVVIHLDRSALIAAYRFPRNA